MNQTIDESELQPGTSNTTGNTTVSTLMLTSSQPLSMPTEDTTLRNRSGSTSSSKKRKKGMIESPTGKDSPRWASTLVHTWNEDLQDYVGQNLTRDIIEKVFKKSLYAALQTYESEKEYYESEILKLKKDKSENMDVEETAGNTILNEIREIKNHVQNELDDIKQSIQDHVKPRYAQIAAVNANKPQTEKIIINNPILTILMGRDKPEGEKEFHETKKSIAQILSPIKNKIRITYIRQSRKGNIVIGFETIESQRLAKTILKETSDKTIHDPEDRKIPIIIRDVNHQFYSHSDQLKENFIKYNADIFRTSEDKEIFEIHWIERKIQGRTSYILKALAPKRLAQHMLNQGRIFNEYESYRCQLWQVTPIKCRKCHQLNHKEHSCNHQTICGHCSQTHSTDQCNKQGGQKCATCIAAGKQDEYDHSSTSNDCPTWQKEKIKLNQELEQFLWN